MLLVSYCFIRFPNKSSYRTLNGLQNNCSNKYICYLHCCCCCYSIADQCTSVCVFPDTWKKDNQTRAATKAIKNIKKTSTAITSFCEEIGNFCAEIIEICFRFRFHFKTITFARSSRWTPLFCPEKEKQQNAWKTKQKQNKICTLKVRKNILSPFRYVVVWQITCISVLSESVRTKTALSRYEKFVFICNKKIIILPINPAYLNHKKQKKIFKIWIQKTGSRSAKKDTSQIPTQER